jgi:hypothetical protein
MRAVWGAIRRGVPPPRHTESKPGLVSVPGRRPSRIDSQPCARLIAARISMIGGERSML